ncbi:MAG: AMP-binding protein [Alteromonadaceae bacterium]|nr:AMP-binding protein [Alteromonadaceae bacterium]
MNTVNLPLPAEKLTYWLVQDGNRDVLFQPHEGKYLTYNWKQIDDEARRLTSFLQSKGLVPGDKVSILSKNTAHWLISDLALMLGGFISVPIYPTANNETIKFVVEHSESKAIIVGKLDNWPGQAEGVPKDIISIAMPYPTMPTDYQWNDVIANNDPIEQVYAATPEELMTILYTSGSTGNPKGAMHSFASFVNAGKNVGERLGATTNDRSLSYLPLSHCTERAYVESVWLNYGTALYFVESLETFADNMAYARPTVFGSVPRLWTQFQKKILTAIPNKKLQTMLKIPILRGLVKKKIKKQMGLDSAHLFLSGSAPLSEKVLEWYSKLDINIAEGWGMTESFAVGSQIGPGMDVRFGTVSVPINGSDVVIAEDSEILIKTESDMMGYYKDEEKTKETINEDGYIMTGDLGEIKDGYLSIVGRKKDIFKTEKGKYVAPIPIESDFGDNEYIELMCLMGTHLVQPVLVVNLSPHAASIDKADLEQSLLETMSTVNSKLEAHAKVGAIIVAQNEWTTDSGELTPTLKVKRHVVEKAFLEKAQSVKKGSVTWE